MVLSEEYQNAETEGVLSHKVWENELWSLTYFVEYTSSCIMIICAEFSGNIRDLIDQCNSKVFYTIVVALNLFC